MGLEVGGKGNMKEKKKEKDNIPPICESICHQPLRGCCPKESLSDLVLWKSKSGARSSQSVRANRALLHLFQFR